MFNKLTLTSRPAGKQVNIGQHHVGGQLLPISQILYLSAVRMVSVFSGQCLSVWILSVSILSVVQVLFGFLEPADMGKDAKKQRSVTHPSSPRIWPVSKGCPNFPDRSVRCLVSVLILCSVSVCRVSVYPDSVCLDSVRILPGCFEKNAIRGLFIRPDKDEENCSKI